jgi:REP element-mobilizing transposase RayT
MVYDSAKHHRRSIRLRHYDYSRAGAYFITVCVDRRASILGAINDDRAVCSPVGQIVHDTWSAIATRFPQTELDEFVIMPNHVHALLWILRPEVARGTTSKPVKLGGIVGAFKSISTIEVNRARSSPGQALWQRNYYEHVVRDDDELYRIRKYIVENPARWGDDEENPANWERAPGTWEPASW